MLLLDTNVISELVRPAPDSEVQRFFLAQNPDSVFTAAICEAEIHYGLARMPAGRRRTNLSARATAFIAETFLGQVLAFDSSCAEPYGIIRARREAAGRPIEPEDAMIAAIAAVHGAVLITRNVADFEGCGIQIVNPWQAVQP